MLKLGKKSSAPTQASSVPERAAQPYLNARREWDERYGNALAHARNWRMVALVSSLVALVATLGVVWIGAQSKIQPFVVAVNELGTPIAVGRPSAASSAGEVDERIVKALLANFIFNARAVLTDFQAQQILFNRTFAMLGRDVVDMMTAFSRDDRMALQQKSARVSVSVQSVIPMSADSWQVEWTETIDEPGSASRTEHWRAIVTIGFSTAYAEKSPFDNPYGLFIKQIAWQKVSQ